MGIDCFGLRKFFLGMRVHGAYVDICTARRAIYGFTIQRRLGF